jgi:hypothetical protein
MAKTATPDTMGHLVLGWRVDESTLAPSYWYDSHARPGQQSDRDLVQIPADRLGCHTAIVAQSGSGNRSFWGD